MTKEEILDELSKPSNFAKVKKLIEIGVLATNADKIRNTNVGKSDYSQHLIQPWSIWQDYNLNAWDADIVKRVLRTKQGENRISDYQKIIHVCEERIRQIQAQEEMKNQVELIRPE